MERKNRHTLNSYSTSMKYSYYDCCYKFYTYIVSLKSWNKYRQAKLVECSNVGSHFLVDLLYKSVIYICIYI